MSETTERSYFIAASFATSALALSGCGAAGDPGPQPCASATLEDRAYIVSAHSDELTVIDLERLEIGCRVRTGGVHNHMAELNRDFTKIYLDSSTTDENVVIDARTFEIVKRIPLGRHPTHLKLTPDGRLLAVMNEDEDAISFVDTEQDVEIKRLSGFDTPHFMRFSADGRFGYAANLGAHHLTRVDLSTLEIDAHIPLDGFEGPPNATPAPAEGGFADAQIGRDGILYAAHAATGRVLVYDTERHQKLPEIGVGRNPWIIFAEHPFPEVANRHLGPNFGDRTVSMIDGDARSILATLPGDSEAYGVNYSSIAPDKAFVMNRIREDVTVVDTTRGEITDRIPVGGNTETASTTADGRFIVATVSSADRVVVIDAATNEVVKTFDDVGDYPWSVTIPNGQNYCH